MKSIFSKLMLSFISTILVVIIIVGTFFSSMLKSYITNQKKSELISKGKTVVSITSRYLNNFMDRYTFAYTISSIDDVIGSRTVILDKSGNIIHLPSSSKNNRTDESTIVLTKDDLNKLFGGETITKESKSISNELLLTVCIPVYLSNNTSSPMAAVVLSAPLDTSSVVDRTTRILIISVLLALIIAISVSYIFSRNLSSPIKKISISARNIADGNYGNKLDIKRDDEIGSLASSFNYLDDKLRNTIDDLTAEKSKLSDILWAMEEGVIALENNMNIIQLNPAAASLLNLQNKSTEDLVNSLGDDIVDCIKDTLKTGINHNVTLHTNTGSEISVRTSPLRFNSDAIYGTVILLQDISASVKLEKMRRDFVANVSHELRTPLTSIMGFIEPLIDGTADTEEIRHKYCLIIKNETHRLQRLINDLLDLSRLQSGKIKLDLQRLDMNDLINNISMRFEPLLRSKNITLSHKVLTDNTWVLADGDRIEQLMVIFIDNAVKYTPENGHITTVISKDNSDELTRISITNSGPGIPKEDIEFVWDRFYKVSKSRTDKQSGTGLGLAIAKSILEMHGQTPSVDSVLGSYTTFSFPLQVAYPADN